MKLEREKDPDWDEISDSIIDDEDIVINDDAAFDMDVSGDNVVVLYQERCYELTGINANNFVLTDLEHPGHTLIVESSEPVIRFSHFNEENVDESGYNNMNYIRNVDDPTIDASIISCEELNIDDDATMAEDTLAMAEYSLAMIEDPPAMAEDPPAMAEDPLAMAEYSLAMIEDPPAMAEDPPAMAEDPLAMVEYSLAMIEDPLAMAEYPPANAGVVFDAQLENMLDIPSLRGGSDQEQTDLCTRILDWMANWE